MAECSARIFPRHAAPVGDCGCGLYASKRLGWLFRRSVRPLGPVIGRVALWGSVVEHRQGWRAGVAYPSRLYLICEWCLQAAAGPGVPSHAWQRKGVITAACPEHRWSAAVGRTCLGEARDVEQAILAAYAVDRLAEEPLAAARAELGVLRMFEAWGRPGAASSLEARLQRRREPLVIGEGLRQVLAKAERGRGLRYTVRPKRRVTWLARLPRPRPSVALGAATSVVDEAFLPGVDAFARRSWHEALDAFRSARGAGGDASEALFEAFCLLGLRRREDAIAALERVVASDVALPDERMHRYGAIPVFRIPLTWFLHVSLEASSASAALLLAALLERSDRAVEVIALVHELALLGPAPPLVAWLAAQPGWRPTSANALRVTEGAAENTDDLSALMLVFRAAALGGVARFDEAHDAVDRALASPDRNPYVLDMGAFTRATLLDRQGDQAAADRIVGELMLTLRFVDVGRMAQKFWGTSSDRPS